jgi:hypothetical protein
VSEEKSRYVPHQTADPDVFVVESDTASDGPEGVVIVRIWR